MYKIKFVEIPSSSAGDCSENFKDQRKLSVLNAVSQTSCYFSGNDYSNSLATTLSQKDRKDDESIESKNLNQVAKKSEDIIQAIVNDRVVMLDWFSDVPNDLDDRVDGVTYSLTNLVSNVALLSCGFWIIKPGEQKLQTPRRYNVLFKVEKGKALVCQQFVKKVMEENVSFYVPLGSPYAIINLSNSENLKLYFLKITP